MTIRVKNASKAYTTEMCVAATLGMEDEYGNPFELITLEWTPRKRNYNQAKTKGFEDTFIERRHGGGLTLTYRKPGSAEWIKSGLSGRFKAQVARTPHNMNILACMYYDNLWTIREPQIRAEVESRANEIDALLDEIKIPIIKSVQVEIEDGRGGAKTIWEDRKVGEESMLDFHKKRRDGHFQRAGERSGAMIEDLMAEKMAILDQKAELFRDRQNLNHVAETLKTEQGLLNDTQTAYLQAGGRITTYKQESLSEKKMHEVRKIAREEFGLRVENKMKKVEIIASIMEAQNTPQQQAVTG